MLMIDAVWEIVREMRLTFLTVLEQCGVFGYSSSKLSFSAEFAKPGTLPIPEFYKLCHLHPCMFSVHVMNTKLDPSCVSASLATNVDLFVCFAERLIKSSSISC